MVRSCSIAILLAVAVACSFAACKKSASNAPPAAKTPHQVAHSSDVAAMKALIDGGLDPNAANRDGQTLLYVAVKGNQLKMAEYLLSAGAGVNVPSSGTGRTPLFQAAFDGFHESLTDMFDDIVDKNAAAMVELLIARGADVNARNQFGWTPLHDAVAGKNLHVVKILLAHGAAADVSDQDGVTPLALAEQSGQVEIATILREHINN